MRGFQRDIRGTTQVLSGMLWSVIAMAGIGGLGYMIKQQMAAIDATAKLSDRIGMTTESLVSLQHAAKISGVETATLDKALEIFTRRLGEVAMGTGEAERALDALNLAAGDLSRLSPSEAISLIADRMNRLTTSADKAAVANYLFGRSGQQLLNLFAQGSSGIARLSREAQRLGLTFSRDMARKVEEANDALTRTKGAVTGLVTSLTIKLSPWIVNTSDQMTDWITSIDDSTKAWASFFKVMGAGFKEIYKLPETIKALGVIAEQAAPSANIGKVAGASGLGSMGAGAGLTGATQGWSGSAGYTPRSKASAPARQGMALPRVITSEEIMAQSSNAFTANQEGWFRYEEALRTMEKFKLLAMDVHEQETRAAAAAQAAADAMARKWESVAVTMEYSLTGALDRMMWEAESWQDAMVALLRDVAREMIRVYLVQQMVGGIMGAFSGGGRSVGAVSPVSGGADYANLPGIYESADIIGSRQAGGSIDRTGLYQLHAGEFVQPAGGMNITLRNESGIPLRAQEPEVSGRDMVIGLVIADYEQGGPMRDLMDNRRG